MRDTDFAEGLPPLVRILPAGRRLATKSITKARLQGPMEALTAACAEVRDVNARLATFLPAEVRHPYNDAPLFAVCLHDAMRAAAARTHSGTPDVGTYFGVLIDRAALVLRYEFADSRGHWDPLYGPSLTTWLAERAGTLPVNHPRPVRLSIGRFVEAMHHRLLPESVLSILPRSSLALSA